MSDCESVENKRKRQDSIQGSKVLLDEEPEAGKLADNDEEEEEEDEEGNTAPSIAAATDSPAGGSSPAKRPRTRADSDNNNSPAPNNADDAKEAAESVQDKVKGISMDDPPKKPAAALPVFGSAFGTGGGFSSFASAAKKASPFAAYTTATSGFAKYATTTSVAVDDTTASAEAASDSEDVAGNEDLDDDDDNVRVAEGNAARRTFEDLLTTKGKETLQLHGAGSPVSTPLTASGFAHPSPHLTLASPLTPVRTFEEDETCLFSTKAKLFELQNAAWKERGGGQFKVNCKTDQPDKCRLLMRTDLTFRLILNVPLFPGLKAVCQGRFVRFTCFDLESKLPITYALRFATDALATATYACISSNIPEDQEEDEDSEDAEEDEEEEEEEEDSDDAEEDEEEEKVGDVGEEEENVKGEEADQKEAEDEEDEENAQSDAESQLSEQHSSNEGEEVEEEEVVEDDDDDDDDDDASAASEPNSDQEQSDSD